MSGEMIVMAGDQEESIKSGRSSTLSIETRQLWEW